MEMDVTATVRKKKVGHALALLPHAHQFAVMDSSKQVSSAMITTPKTEMDAIASAKMKTAGPAPALLPRAPLFAEMALLQAMKNATWAPITLMTMAAVLPAKSYQVGAAQAHPQSARLLAATQLQLEMKNAMTTTYKAEMGKLFFD